MTTSRRWFLYAFGVDRILDKKIYELAREYFVPVCLYASGVDRIRIILGVLAINTFSCLYASGVDRILDPIEL